MFPAIETCFKIQHPQSYFIYNMCEYMR